MQPIDLHSFISGDDSSVVVIDLDYTRQRVRKTNEQLNPGGINAIAIKTNPLISVLRELNNGIPAFEAASLGEIALAKAAGVSNDRIIFDSPVKTESELNWLLENAKGAFINADSLSELRKMQHFSNEFSLGLRINPSVKINTIDSVNVSGGSSKFGELLTEVSTEWIEQLTSIPRLDGLHVHQASQNNDFANTVAGIRKVVDLANALPPKKIKFINIGGGLAYDYHHSKDVDIDAYFGLLKENCPELFNGKYLLITEFGRYYYAGGARVYSRVEHVKDIDNQMKMAIIHVGADMFLRESYNNKDWYHNLSVCDENFQPINRKTRFNYDIGGPLCFAGDIPFRNHELPEIQIGDWLEIHDAGANTFSLWSRHCSRPFPLVLGIKQGQAFVLKPRENLQDVLRFWGDERNS
jgi:diaminopimelate decarboxylase